MPTLLARASAALATVATVALGAAALQSAPAALAAPGAVVINEIESSGGTPGDWVEIMNPGAAPVDLSGYVVKDSDDTHAYTLPAGSVIPAGGLLVLEEAQFGFGLGGADSVRLFDPSGALVDEHAWTAHATATYGRLPDGTGAFGQTPSTKGQLNAGPAATPTPTPTPSPTAPATAVSVVVNEVESNGDPAGDWVELMNTGAAPADLSGFVFKDNDDAHAGVLPAGTVIPAGGFLVLREGTHFTFGLGGADSARLFDPAGALVAEHAWTAHAPVTYGRLPDGSGAFAPTASTPGAPNQAAATPTPTPTGTPAPGAAAIVVNEVESNGDPVGDWAELMNTGATPVDVSGWVFKDGDDTHAGVLPAGSVIAPGGFLVVQENVHFSFGLGAADSARLFDPYGALVAEHAWTQHGTFSWGRCPDGSGDMQQTSRSTMGAANDCAPVAEIPAEPWPGPDAVAPVDQPGQYDGDMSSLDYDPASDTLIATQNGTGRLMRLSWDGSALALVSTTTLTYPGGAGSPDAEGSSAGGDGFTYVGAERDGAASSTSRNSVLAYRTADLVDGATVAAAREWNLTSVLPTTGANTGIETVEWVPDTALAALAGYDPAAYPLHGAGLVFVGLEQTGTVHALALNSDGTAQLVATYTPGLLGVMALDYDTVRGSLWMHCDDGCKGASVEMDLATGAMTRYAAPAAIAGLNSEGFATSPAELCVDGARPVWWTDDAATGGRSLLAGRMDCPPEEPVESLRLAGADRYETAVQVSLEYGIVGNPVILATGQSYADALAAGPMAAKLDASLLLTPHGALPASVSAEIARLQPSMIYVIGSTESVSDDVLAVASAYASGARAERIAGSDRVATARAIADRFFSAADGAFLATGWNFPDALSASSAGALTERPVLLTPAGSLDDRVEQYLAATPVQEVDLVGGEPSLSATVLAEAQAAAPAATVSRLWGDDRYATNIAVDREFPGAEVDAIVVATGRNFPDALVAAVAVDREQAPLVLTPGGCATEQTASYLAEIGEVSTTSLGDELAVQDGWSGARCP